MKTFRETNGGRQHHEKCHNVPEIAQSLYGLVANLSSFPLNLCEHAQPDAKAAWHQHRHKYACLFSAAAVANIRHGTCNPSIFGVCDLLCRL